VSTPKTLVEAVRHFSDPDVCHEYMVGVKWADGRIVCPKCGGEKVGFIASRRVYQCKATGCRKQFSAKVGTIFEDSPLPLSSWFVAVWSVANCKNGISSYELARALGITQKSAWFALHRIRMAMGTPTFTKFAGITESDETFVGGRAANMHRRRRERAIQGRGPSGAEFDALLGKLAQVPKEEAERRAAQWKKKRAAKKKKKPKQ
jgi:transposase-like protein